MKEDEGLIFEDYLPEDVRVISNIIKNLAYEIYDRRKKAGFADFDDSAKNYQDAERMINEVLMDIEEVMNLTPYLSEEDLYALSKVKANRNR